jgi:prepilin-type N-terminal cleavage/methylation domain-containing protein
MNRRGFTLTELLMSLMVMAILGVALTRILINDSRFVSRQDAMLASRQSARAALNTVLAELAMVGDFAVLAATRDSLTVRVPYAFGISCRAPTTTTKVVSLMPVDSLVWASMTSPGIYWRTRTGNYTLVTSSPLTITSNLADSTYCRSDSVRFVPGGKIIRIAGLATAQVPESIAVIQMYQLITYKFAASTDLPGRIGLWRRLSGATAEEIVTPFDTSARFAYLVGGPSAATLALRTTTIAAASLDSVRGVELRLNAASENTAQGTAAPQVFRLRTRVRFANKTGLP